MTITFGRENGLAIKRDGVAYQKHSVTWLLDPGMTVDFYVVTDIGRVHAAAGSLLCYDEKSGNVWPTSPDYVKLNYQKADMDDSAESNQTVNQLLYRAVEALSAAARHLSAVDVANAEVNLAEARYRPLTMLCGEAAAAVSAYLESEVGLATEENVGLGHNAEVQQIPTRDEHGVRTITPNS